MWLLFLLTKAVLDFIAHEGTQKGFDKEKVVFLKQLGG